MGEEGEEIAGGLAVGGDDEVALPPAAQREGGADEVAEGEAGGDDPLGVNERGVLGPIEALGEGAREREGAALAVRGEEEVEGLALAEEAVVDPDVGEDR